MTMLRILQHPDPRLKLKGQLVDDPTTPHFQTIIKNMFETLYGSKNCAALAATQLDIDTPYRITVIDFSENKDQPLCLVNPEITEKHDELTEREGCMSVLGIFESVTRAESIHVKALDQHGKTLDFEADGFMAKCIQHELDHLDGKLFIDYFSPLKRRMIEKKIKKLKRIEDKSS